MDLANNTTCNYEHILVTGGAGFIGGNLSIYFKEKYPNLCISAIDNLKRRGSELNIPRLKKSNIQFVHGDIRNKEDLNFEKKIDCIIECSAEPAVTSGYFDSPLYLLNTNLIGTINCLELAKLHSADIIFLSTNRVYPYDEINCLQIVEKETRYEWNPDQIIEGWSMKGIDIDYNCTGVRSLYGATKLCSEIILLEYLRMYNLKGIINRCSVIAGPWQFGRIDQGVFALWVFSHFFKKSLTYYGFHGKGKQVRDVLHISDLSDLIDKQLKKIDIFNGNIYNVGGGIENSISLLETTNLCEQIIGNKIIIKSDLKNRPADIIIYISDIQRVAKDFNWAPKKSVQEIIFDLYNWTKENKEVLSKILY